MAGFKKNKFGKWKKENKYIIIVKVGQDDFLKYRCRNLLKLCEFLDKKWPTWRWFNVYDKNRKLASYSKFRRPTSHSVDGHFFE
jgi:hypothetical protein